MTTEAPQVLKADACPDAALLATYVDGGLSAAERASVEAHLSKCAECREIVGEVVAVAATRVPRTRRFPRRALFAVGGGLLATAAALLLVVRLQRPSPYYLPEMAELVKAVGTNRPVEPRLTGGFAYGLPPDATRGPADAVNRLAAVSAAESVKQAALGSREPAALAATGVASLMLGNATAAVESLDAARRVASRGDVLSDLAAALLIAGAERRDADYLQRARRAADEAVALAPELPEAWFNRALAVEATDSSAAGIKAWEEYIARETSAEWIAEARRHIQRLQTPGRTSKETR